MENESKQGFLEACKTKKIEKLTLVDAYLIVNPSAADFYGVIFDFEDCRYFISSKTLCKTDDEVVTEFDFQKIKNVSETEDVTENNIYGTITPKKNDISFLTELIDEHGCFSGLELKIDEYFLFITTTEKAVVVNASYDESLKYFLYANQFGKLDEEYNEVNEYVRLFPEG